MNRLAAVAIVALFLATGAGGCLEQLGLGALGRPDYPVARTAVLEDGWNTESTFTVQVEQVEPVNVRIEARPADGGIPRSAEGLSDVATPIQLEIPDGTWTIVYFVGGHEWETFEGARFDTTPPSITGLEPFAEADGGSARFGAAASVEDGADVEVVSQATGQVVGRALPVTVSGLSDGVHAYDVHATDEAGNAAVATVQVLVGSATQLPAPRYTAGIVARYAASLRLWDLSDLDAYDSPAQARQAAPGRLGAGQGITPQDASVQAVVEAVVDDSMSTAEAALALYRWMFDELEYDEARLEEEGLLDPDQTMAAGGGVCRDLAALYVSLLRAAGIPSRLVTGYLAGRVNGFHAWVEFYGGLGPQGSPSGSPWVPVDVSGIDGEYEDVAMLQAFAVALPEHLAFRALTTSEEATDWSSAATLGWSKASGDPDPDAPFLKDVRVVSEQRKVLCVDEETRSRRLASAPGRNCPSYIPDFTEAATRVLDFGVQVRSAPEGTEFSLSLVYPDVDGAKPDEVEFLYYLPKPATGLQSEPFAEDEARGRADTTITV